MEIKKKNKEKYFQIVDLIENLYKKTAVYKMIENRISAVL